MEFKISPLWQIVLMLIFIPVTWVIIWFGLALIGHFTGIPVPSIADASALLSTIGSIMGAVFAVGGLIVALVAILTQIQLEDRIQKQVNEAKNILEETFEMKIRAEYEKQIQDQIEGTLAFADATRATSWQDAEELMRKSLQKYPNLPGAYSIIGLRLSQEVELSYTNALFPSLLLPPAVFFGYVAPVSVQSSDMPTSNLPKLEAITWLENALEHQDNPEEKVSLALALMYGYNEYYDKMINILREIEGRDASLLSYFRTATRLFMLIQACSKDYGRIEEVAKAINYSLPTKADIEEAIHNPKIPSYQPVDWFAIELSNNALKMPATVGIFKPSPSNESYATLVRGKLQPDTIPPIDPGRDPSLGIQMLPVDDLINQISQSFFVICLKNLGL